MTLSKQKLIVNYAATFIFLAVFIVTNLIEGLHWIAALMSGMCTGLMASRFGDWTSERWFGNGHGQDNPESDSESKKEGRSDSR